MSTRPALAGAAATAVLAGVLGSPAAQDAASRDGAPLLTRTVTALPSWEVPDGAPASLVWGIVLRLAVLLLVALGLCAVAGRSRSRSAALLAGWGALVVAAGLAGVAGYLYGVAVVVEGASLGDVTGDGVVGAVNAGIGFGAWTGWLVGLAVALATRTEPAFVFADETAGHAAPAAGGRRIRPAGALVGAHRHHRRGRHRRPPRAVGVPGRRHASGRGRRRARAAPARRPVPAGWRGPGDDHRLGRPPPVGPRRHPGGRHPRLQPDASEDEDPDATTTIPEATTDPTRQMPRPE